MAESLVIFGLVAAIVQFVDFSSKIIERLNEFQSSIDEVPQTFRDLRIQLPLLQETLKRTKAQAETGLIDKDTQKAVLDVVEGCRLQASLLNDCLVKTLPATGDSKVRRGIKAFSSVGQEKDVQKILDRIQRYQINLIHFQTTPAPQELPTRTRSLFTVPFPRDPRFTGRQYHLQSIDESFKAHRRVALAGLGGVGKSQIAIEYCYRFRETHPQSTVVWVHTSNVSRIDQAYKEIARKAQLQGWDSPQTNKLALVADWLSQDETGEWLMVLDNADDSDVFFNAKHDLLLQESGDKTIANYVPQSTKGRVLITTRDRRVGERLTSRVKAINVPTFTAQEAEDLLESLLDKDDIGNKTDARELIDTLAHLPLAITQAAAFMMENNMAVVEYLEALRAGDTNIKDLLSEELVDSRRDSETQNSLIRTWKLSFDYIRKSKPRAAELLSLMSVLDRQGIPKFLLRRKGEKLTEFTTAIGTLQAFSLITTEKAGSSFEIHRLVHLVTQQWLELEGEIKLWREEALKVMSEVYPEGSFEDWAVCNLLSPHMQAVVDYAYDSDTCQLRAATLLDHASFYDLTQGRYDTASDKSSRALEIRKTLLGPEHPDTLKTMDHLAETYMDRGRLKEAEEVEVRLVETSKRVLGAEHHDTVTSMHNLATTYSSQGRLTEAEELLTQVVEMRKRFLGEEHLHTLVSLNNLGLNYRNQGRFSEAEEVQILVMEVRKKLLGVKHPHTLISMDNLALTYWGQKRWTEAEELQVQVMETIQTTLGVEHPDTLTSMDNLARTWKCQGRDGEAFEMIKSVAQVRRRVLGDNHPQTVFSTQSVDTWQTSS